MTAIFQSSLTNRGQQIRTNFGVSNIHEIISGVLQGPVLGPPLFIIRISDIHRFIVNCGMQSIVWR